MKKNYSINEVAKLFSITTNKLRFYEKKGLITSQREGPSNYRFYTREDIERIQIILTYRVLGFSISDIKDMLEKNDKQNHLDHFSKQWKEINNQIDRLQLLRSAMEELIDNIYDANNNTTNDLLIDSIKKVNEIISIKDNWKDRWNFNGWAKSYDDSVRNGNDPLNMYENYDQLLSTVYEQSTEGISQEYNSINVLDIGVGTGNLAKKYLDAGFQVYGVDQSRQMLNVAKDKFPELRVRLGEFMKLPFSDNTFDIIASTYAFHHLNKHEKIISIAEMIRVLKDDGVIVIGDLMFENNQRKREIFSTLSEKQIEIINDEYYTNIEKVQDVFKQHNKILEYMKIDYLNYIIIVK